MQRYKKKLEIRNFRSLKFEIRVGDVYFLLSELSECKHLLLTITKDTCVGVG